MIVATAGHVDHGKTTLIRTLTGVDTDRLELEKQRGLSIELGFAYWNDPSGRRFGFVDVPGHAKFLPTMAAGIGGIDAALLVVAADDGLMPQTREHVTVLEFLGVTEAIVVLSKCDTVDSDKLDRVRNELSVFLAKTSISASPVIAVDSHSGTGLEPLIRELSGLTPRDRPIDSPARMSIDRSFVLKGVGLIATGTLLSGRISVGDRLTVAPAGHEVRIRGIHAQDQKADHAAAGQRCALNLTGARIDTKQVKRGCWLVANEGRTTTSRLETEIRFTKDTRPGKSKDIPVHLHIGAAKYTARLVLLGPQPSEATDIRLAQLITDQPVDAVFGDRFVLRSNAGTKTIAGGRVLSPYGATRGRAKSDRLMQLAALQQTDPTAAIGTLLQTPPYSVDTGRFANERGLWPAAPVFAPGDKAVAVTGRNGSVHYINTQYWQKWKAEIESVLQKLHETSPHLPGYSAKQLMKGMLKDPPLSAVFACILDELVNQSAIVFHAGTYALNGFAPSLKAEDEKTWLRAKPVFESAGPQAPTVHEIARTLSLAPDDLGDMLNRAAALSLVRQISRNRYLLPETVSFFEKVLSTLASEQTEGFAATVFRDRAGIGRNLAIDVLEYFDRQGITKRQGNLRKIG